MSIELQTRYFRPGQFFFENFSHDLPQDCEHWNVSENEWDEIPKRHWQNISRESLREYMAEHKVHTLFAEHLTKWHEHVESWEELFKILHDTFYSHCKEKNINKESACAHKLRKNALRKIKNILHKTYYDTSKFMKPVRHAHTEKCNPYYHFCKWEKSLNGLDYSNDHDLSIILGSHPIQTKSLQDEETYKIKPEHLFYASSSGSLNSVTHIYSHLKNNVDINYYELFRCQTKALGTSILFKKKEVSTFIYNTLPILPDNLRYHATLSRCYYSHTLLPVSQHNKLCDRITFSPNNYIHTSPILASLQVEEIEWIAKLAIEKNFPLYRSGGRAPFPHKVVNRPQLFYDLLCIFEETGQLSHLSSNWYDRDRGYFDLMHKVCNEWRRNSKHNGWQLFENTIILLMKAGIKPLERHSSSTNIFRRSGEVHRHFLAAIRNTERLVSSDLTAVYKKQYQNND